jgi:CxxC motif-containing protein (DUF1111 family)
MSSSDRPATPDDSDDDILDVVPYTQFEEQFEEDIPHVGLVASGPDLLKELLRRWLVATPIPLLAAIIAEEAVCLLLAASLLVGFAARAKAEARQRAQAEALQREKVGALEREAEVRQREKVEALEREAEVRQRAKADALAREMEAMRREMARALNLARDEDRERAKAQALNLATAEDLRRATALSGEALFKHEWQPCDSLSRGGDGLGPVFNATSCVTCHHQAGFGGSGGLEHNVTTFAARDRKGGAVEGVVHAYGVGLQETLRDVHPDLPPISRPSLEQLAALGTNDPAAAQALRREVSLSQRNTPALFGARLIDELPAEVIVNNALAQLRKQKSLGTAEIGPVGRVPCLPNGRVGRFGWKAQMASLSDFVQAACANELGLANPGHPQPRPLSQPYYLDHGLDLSKEQCDQISAFVASLARPAERLLPSTAERSEAASGKHHFSTIGCADCHTPNLGSIEGLYSDLLLHNMGRELAASGAYYGAGPGNGSPSPGEWRTPPLWGVADSGPYLHDGRAPTLEQAIRLHDGQGRPAAERFVRLGAAEQAQLIAFLRTLRAPAGPTTMPPASPPYHPGCTNVR